MNRINLFKEVLEQCKIALKKNPHVFPLRLVIDQITYLLDIEENHSSDVSKLKFIQIGWITARELDGFSDNDLLEKLYIVAEEAEKIKKEKLSHD